MAKKQQKSLKSPIEIIREPKAITDEYGTVCGKAGEAQFKMKALEGELNQYNQRLAELHMEYTKAQAEAEKKAKLAPAQEATPA